MRVVDEGEEWSLELVGELRLYTPCFGEERLGRDAGRAPELGGLGRTGLQLNQQIAKIAGQLVRLLVVARIEPEPGRGEGSIAPCRRRSM